GCGAVHASVRPRGGADAYAGVPRPIGRGQSLSAPSMIAIMLEEARLAPGDHGLELGTGSGYHAALVARIVGPQHVVSIERIPRIAEWGRSNLARVGYAGVTVVAGDGSLGFPEQATFD